MTPAKALELVERYSRLHHAIAGCKPRIGDHLEQCHGQKGYRKETEFHCGFDGNGSFEAPTRRSDDDQETHLPLWYKPTINADDYEPELRYRDIGSAEQAECPHCFAAHLVIQERKALKRQFAAVKGAFSRAVKPATVDQAAEARPTDKSAVGIGPSGEPVASIYVAERGAVLTEWKDGVRDLPEGDYLLYIRAPVGS